MAPCLACLSSLRPSKSEHGDLEGPLREPGSGTIPDAEACLWNLNLGTARHKPAPLR
jgi:hypothetical protein